MLASLLQGFFSNFELTNHNTAAQKKRKGSWLDPCQMEYGDSSEELAKKMRVCAQPLYKIKQSLEIPPL